MAHKIIHLSVRLEAKGLDWVRWTHFYAPWCEVSPLHTLSHLLYKLGTWLAKRTVWNELPF